MTNDQGAGRVDRRGGWKLSTEFLKCDADDCIHVEQVGAITGDMVNMPCPVCGSNLLTLDDWEKWSALIKPILKAFPHQEIDGTEDGPMIKATVHLHDNKVTVATEIPTEDDLTEKDSKTDQGDLS